MAPSHKNVAGANLDRAGHEGPEQAIIGGVDNNLQVANAGCGEEVEAVVGDFAADGGDRASIAMRVPSAEPSTTIASAGARRDREVDPERPGERSRRGQFRPGRRSGETRTRAATDSTGLPVSVIVAVSSGDARHHPSA
jgi:hypothetical protein